MISRFISNWRLRTCTLELGARTLIMGVVNITPDSFSDGGLFLDPAAAISHGLQLLEDGADILDLGAESTRPGSHVGAASTEPSVSSEEEQARLLPVLEGILRAHPSAIISVDTYKAATARAALAAGAEIVNDVSGFTWDAEMAPLCAEYKCGIVLMHTRGRPDEWRALPALTADEVLAVVRDGLAASLAASAEVGIAAESVVLDPGYGFGKRFNENFVLLARQDELLSLGRPLLAGVSRKSFLGNALKASRAGSPAPALGRIQDCYTHLKLGAPGPSSAAAEGPNECSDPGYTNSENPLEREAASIAAMVAAILHGASIVRVHEVRSAVDAAAIADAVVLQQTSMDAV